MQSFLEKVTDYITAYCGDNPGSVCIVLPNRRAGIFIRKLIAAKYPKPVWAPEIMSVEDFIFRLSGLRQCDNLGQLFRLYQVHVKLKGNGQSFQDFLKWGQVMIEDFNETDLHLANPEMLFGYLSEAKAISMWNPDGSELTAFQKSYLDFFSSISVYYGLFKQMLEREKLAYKGMAYRKVAEGIEESSRNLPWKRIFFTGLNALTRSEEEIIRFLAKNEMAELLWDADTYYINDPKQEAGLFMRQYIKDPICKEFRWIESNLQTRPAKIETIGVPGLVAQARVAGEVLAGMVSEASSPSTAVILADESLLLPVLNSIPPGIAGFNVTMGLPLNQLPVYEFVMQWIKLHVNALQNADTGISAIGNTQPARFRLADFNNLTGHPLLQEMFLPGDGDWENSFDAYLEKWVRQNRIFISPDDLRKATVSLAPNARRLVELFTTPIGSDYTSTGLFLEAFALLRDHKLAENAELLSAGSGQDPAEKHLQVLPEVEYLYHFARIFKRLRTVWEEAGIMFGPETLQFLFEGMAGTTAIPFTGEPLRGMQVMGMLETRTLDFKTVILVSANEGYLPSVSRRNSFIPFDIQREFGLHTHIERNAVFAYHFYRLLQRATNIYLIYNTEAGKLGGEEKSRFLLQLLHEYKGSNKSVTFIDRPGRPLGKLPGLNDKIIINKDEAVMDQIRFRALKGLSPSALNVFRNCQMRFYFREIAGLSESDELEEAAAAVDLGTGIHEALNQLYEPYLNAVMKPEYYDIMTSQLEAVLLTSFVRKTRFNEFKRGKNLLLFSAALLAIKRFLLAEQNMISSPENSEKQLVVAGLEKKYRMLFDPGEGTAASGNTIYLKGTIDRLDVYGKTQRLIDYKTGRVNPAELKLKQWEDLSEKPERDKVFQLLFYALLVKGEKGDGFTEVEPCIISLRSQSSVAMPLRIIDRETAGLTDLDQFTSYLQGLLHQLFDKESPFVQTPDKQHCKNCPFRDICVR